MKYHKTAIVALLIFFLSAGCTKSGTITITLSPDLCAKGGKNLAEGIIPSPEDLAIDAYCAERLIARSAPNGVITIFGSARTKAGEESYEAARKFANLWTKTEGKKYPVLTGGGPGIMEAGNRGAMEAGGQSLSFATYFGSGVEKPNKYTTDGFMFASFSQREAEMVDRAAAIVIAPGGIGTEWEIYESMAKIQTAKKKKSPIILLGKKEVWKTLFDRLGYLKKIKTISPDDTDLLTIAETPEQAVAIIKKELKLQ